MIIRNILNISLAPSNLRRVKRIIETTKSAMVYIDAGIDNVKENLPTGNGNSDILCQLMSQRIEISELLGQAILEEEILEWICDVNK